MTISTIKTYINLISGSLDKFRRLPGSEKYNFRCVYCGDSEKTSSKARGYLLPNKKSDGYFYFCHNCKVSKPFHIFLKEKFYDLYREYTMDSFSQKGSMGSHAKIKADILETKPKETAKMDLKTIEMLRSDHFARTYVERRRIPKEWHSEIMFTENFQEFTNTLIPGKFPKPYKNDPRLVIPFHDSDGKLIGFQGRSVPGGPVDTKVRYFTIMLNENARKIFNLNRVDTNKPYYICEGPIDAMFLDNCLAVAGSDIKTAMSSLPNISNATVILDNQPRNKEVVSEYAKCVDFGVKVFFWPDYIEEKDINDVICFGNRTASELQSIIDSHSYKGLRAKVELSNWKKI